MSKIWHNKYAIQPTRHDESDDIEAAKAIQLEREEKREELLQKIRTYSEEDKY